MGLTSARDYGSGFQASASWELYYTEHDTLEVYSSCFVELYYTQHDTSEIITIINMTSYRHPSVSPTPVRVVNILDNNNKSTEIQDIQEYPEIQEIHEYSKIKYSGVQDHSHCTHNRSRG